MSIQIAAEVPSMEQQGKIIRGKIVDEKK